MDQANHAYNPEPCLRHAPPKVSQEILIGEAGVHLVISKLLAWRIPAREAMAGLSYDIIADLESGGLLRIQVKTTTRLHGRKLRFRMQRGFYYSRRGNFDYGRADFDIAAFVHLPPSKVCFWASPRRSVSFDPVWLNPPGVEYKTWLLALEHHKRSRIKHTSDCPAPADGSTAP